MNILFMVMMALGLLLLLVLVIYLVDRVNSLEASTRDAHQEAQKTGVEDVGPFGGLSGKKLWDAMSGKPPPHWDKDQINDVRERYSAVLQKHIEMLFAEGVSDARSGLSGTPRNTRMISTLRGTVESWLPTVQNNSIYQCGVDSAQSTTETLPLIRQRVDEACGDLYQQTQLSPRQPFSTILLPESAASAEATPTIQPAADGATGTPPSSAPAESRSG